LPLLSAKLTALLGPERFRSGRWFPAAPGRQRGAMGSTIPICWRHWSAGWKPPAGSEHGELIKWVVINVIRTAKDQMGGGGRKRREENI